jgi:hypothetical protein
MRCRGDLARWCFHVLPVGETLDKASVCVLECKRCLCVAMFKRIRVSSYDGHVSRLSPDIGSRIRTSSGDLGEDACELLLKLVGLEDQQGPAISSEGDVCYQASAE